MSKKTVLSGNLEFLTLADIFQLLGGIGSSGILRIISKYAQEPGLVYFTDGNPINATCGVLTGLEAVYALFGWTEGEFTFTKETFSAQKTIKNSRMEILLDGLRRLDDGKTQKLGPASVQKTDPDKSEAPSLPVIKGPLVDYMFVVDEEEFSDGSEIVVEGKHGNWIWVILEGAIDIVRNIPSGPLKILRVGEGAFVGSLAAFTMGGDIRSATAVAVGRVVLGVLDSQRLATEHTTMSHDLNTVALSLDRRLRQMTEKIVQYHLNEKEPTVSLKDKKMVIKKGSSGKELYFITHGDAYVALHIKKKLIPMVHLSVGDFFGHVPFIEVGNEPDSASILGSKDLKITKLDVETIQKEYDNLSPTFKNLLENSANCNSATTLLASDAYRGIHRN
jgi:hypothetical protein